MPDNEYVTYCSNSLCSYVQCIDTCVQFEGFNTNIFVVTDIRNKYGYQMKNTEDIIEIIYGCICSRQMHFCVKFDMSNNNISAAFDI